MKLHTLSERFLISYKGVYSPATVQWYENRFKPLLGEMGNSEIAEITIDDLRSLYALLAEKGTLYDNHPHKGRKIEKSYSPHSLHAFARSWKRLFKWGVEEGHIEVSPARRLKLPQLPTPDPKAISPENVIKLLKAAKEFSKTPVRDRAIIRFLADTNARVAGVAGLMQKSLDLENMLAKIYEKGKGGNGNMRTVFFRKNTRLAVDEWLKIRPDRSSDKRVFLLSESGIYQMLDRMAAKVTLQEEPHNPHAFLHGFAKGVLGQGANLAQVSQMMGHSTVSVTVQYYSQFATQELQKFHARYPWIPDDE